MSGTMALMLLAGCATTPGTDRLAQKDPLHGFNRAMWGLDRGLDKVIAKPVAKVYRAVTPTPLRSGIRNFFSNLTEPWSFINALLQGNPKRAGRALERFALNSTIGIGGLFDHATKAGLKQQPEDFGQTLAVWGANAGPYLVLPLFGPSTLRDGIGTAVGQFADPYSLCLEECGIPSAARWALRGTALVSDRAQLMESGADKLLDASADSYATAKSAYLQRRRALIANSEDETEPSTIDLEDFETNDQTTTPPTGETPNPSGVTPPTPAAPEAPKAPDGTASPDSGTISPDNAVPPPSSPPTTPAPQ
jgi:phospholipid-binding lipoprotein MlaA